MFNLVSKFGDLQHKNLRLSIAENEVKKKNRDDDRFVDFFIDFKCFYQHKDTDTDLCRNYQFEEDYR